MNKFEAALEDCLSLLSQGRAGIDECLDRYPEHAAELAPLLRSAEKLLALGTISASPEFRARGRQTLQNHMAAHPRRKANSTNRLFASPRMRLATSFAAVALALVSTGTVLAQAALPGDFLYAWKLQSERVWAAFFEEDTDYKVAISGRRVYEYVRVSGNPVVATRALENYTSSISKLLMALDLNPDQLDEVYHALLEQQEVLKNYGLQVPELDMSLETLSDALPEGTGQETDQEFDSPADGEGGQGLEGDFGGVSTAVAPFFEPGGEQDYQSPDNAAEQEDPGIEEIVTGSATAAAPILEP